MSLKVVVTCRGFDILNREVKTVSVKRKHFAGDLNDEMELALL